MKKFIYILMLSLLCLTCEDVIDVDVENAPPKLVIDASLNWFDGTTGENQIIKLTLTAPYFDNQVPPATGAIVTVTNSSNVVFSFTDSNANGEYLCDNFIPIMNEEYTLNIQYNNENYTATESLLSVAPIDFIEQNNEGGFLGDEIEIKAYYTDPANEENYYFFELNVENELLPVIDIYSDEFINGNQFFAFYSDEDLEPQDVLTIRSFGVSEQFYDFSFILLQQSSEGGGPFEVQPATVRGNCINLTNPDNFPFGYFRVSQATELVYTVE